jgi:putative SOS response-associated peptidase YedK
MATITKLRKGTPDPSISMDRIETAILIGALFKRADMAPAQGCHLTIWFNSEAEAKQMQKLLYRLVPPKTRTKHDRALVKFNAIFDDPPGTIPGT